MSSNLLSFALTIACCSSTDYENFYPKEKKEAPKGNDQKSESKG